MKRTIYKSSNALIASSPGTYNCSFPEFPSHSLFFFCSPNVVLFFSSNNKREVSSLSRFRCSLFFFFYIVLNFFSFSPSKSRNFYFSVYIYIRGLIFCWAGCTFEAPFTTRFRSPLRDIALKVSRRIPQWGQWSSLNWSTFAPFPKLSALDTNAWFSIRIQKKKIDGIALSSTL